MPTYDYACPDCGHKFEEFQPITAAPLRKCPACGKRKVKRLIGTGAGLIFKGSGFYLTDYSRKGGDSKPADSSPADSKPPESKPVESKTAEPKPATAKPPASKPAGE